MYIITICFMEFVLMGYLDAKSMMKYKLNSFSGFFSLLNPLYVIEHIQKDQLQKCLWPMNV